MHGIYPNTNFAGPHFFVRRPFESLEATRWGPDRSIHLIPPYEISSRVDFVGSYKLAFQQLKALLDPQK